MELEKRVFLDNKTTFEEIKVKLGKIVKNIDPDSDLDKFNKYIDDCFKGFVINSRISDYDIGEIKKRKDDTFECRIYFNYDYNDSFVLTANFSTTKSIDKQYNLK